MKVLMKSQASSHHIELTEHYSAHNYSPLEVVLTRGEGPWVWDVDGRKYFDMLSAYSALNFGHANERILAAAQRQITRLTLTSRAFFNDRLGPLSEKLAKLCAMEQSLLMNSGAEAVETALKMARRWGYAVKQVVPDTAEIICFQNNFHGRTTTIVGMSTSVESRDGFGPFTPGFKIVPYGDLEALGKAINHRTVAILFEPIQGEAGIIIPPSGFIAGVRELCSQHNILMLADEIQTGLCRTGALFACDHEGVRPDVYIIGKSLGGGIVPVSAVVTSRSVMDVFSPGSHGSTFGGNPLACAVAEEVIDLITEEKPQERARMLGEVLLTELRSWQSPIIAGVRGRGLLIGIDIHPQSGTAKDFCHRCMDLGVLCKDTRKQTMRLAPPLIAGENDLRWAVERIRQVLVPSA